MMDLYKILGLKVLSFLSQVVVSVGFLASKLFSPLDEKITNNYADNQ